MDVLADEILAVRQWMVESKTFDWKLTQDLFARIEEIAGRYPHRRDTLDQIATHMETFVLSNDERDSRRRVESLHEIDSLILSLRS